MDPKNNSNHLELYPTNLDTPQSKLHEDPQNTPPHQQHLENLIKILYVKHQKNPEIFRGLYKHDLVTLLNKRSKYLQKWLKLAEPIEHLLNVKQRRQGGWDIRKYLKMATHPPDENKKRP